MALTDLGLPERAVTVYDALVGNPHLSLDQVVVLTATSAADVAAAVDDLLGADLLKQDDSAPSGVVALDPSFAVARLIESVEDQMIACYRRVSETRSEIASLAARYAARPTAQDAGRPDVERVDGLGEVRERLDELSFFARKSIYSIQPGGPQSRESLDASRRLDRRSLERGLHMRVVYEAAVLSDALNRTHLRELIKLGVDARVCRETLSRMVVVDERAAVVPIDPADSRRGALIVHHPGLVAGYVTLFERSWHDSDAVPWSDDDVEYVEPVGVADADRHILSLLSSGLTDEAAAREIGCSVRHLRRQIARLIVELDASSRFGAGVEAARRGWI